MNAAERTGPRLATAARCPHGVDDESVCHEKNLRLFASWEYPARRWPPQGNAILNSAGAKPQPEKTCRSWQNRSRSATETSSHVTNRRNRRELRDYAERTRDAFAARIPRWCRAPRARHWMTTRFVTVTRSPPKGGTFARRSVSAMQPPVAVPAKGGPSTSARVARPAFEKVTCTTATPVGSPSLRQPAAEDAAAPSAALAAALSNSPPTSSTCGCSGDGVGFFPSGFAAVASGFG